MNCTATIPSCTRFRYHDFEFRVETDWCADPLIGVGVWVYFRNEPCCDENGHQHRFFLPLGVAQATIKDVCKAFTLATHSENLSTAA